MQLPNSFDPVSVAKIKRAAKINAGAFMAAFLSVFTIEIEQYFAVNDPIDWKKALMAGLGAIFAFLIVSFKHWAEGEKLPQ